MGFYQILVDVLRGCGCDRKVMKSAVFYKFVKEYVLK